MKEILIDIQGDVRKWIKRLNWSSKKWISQSIIMRNRKEKKKCDI